MEYQDYYSMKIRNEILFCRLLSLWRQSSVKRGLSEIWTRILENSADLDQTPHNTTSEQGLHCLFKLQEVKD